MHQIFGHHLWIYTKINPKIDTHVYFIFAKKQMLKFRNVQYVIWREKILGWIDGLVVKTTVALAEVTSLVTNINMMFHNYLYFHF